MLVCWPVRLSKARSRFIQPQTQRQDHSGTSGLDADCSFKTQDTYVVGYGSLTKQAGFLDVRINSCSSCLDHWSGNIMTAFVCSHKRPRLTARESALSRNDPPDGLKGLCPRVT